MSFGLKNKQIELRLEKAGERYRGSRFDWNGLVTQVRFRGTTVLGEEKPLFKRNAARFGRGLHNEFGIKTCVGYDDCKTGEWFPKIGTGWLKKDDKPYFFYTEYELDRLRFDCEVTPDSRALFTCESGERNGYAYRYTKEILLEEAGFRIRYNLENTGSKTLATEEYTHNFLCVGGRPMDAGYSLVFPWKIDPARLGENVNPDGILSIEENRIPVTGKTKKEFYLGGLSNGVTGRDGLASEWTLTHAPSGISVSEKGSFAPSAVHVWGARSVISPEVFFSFKIEAGNILSWERNYSFSSAR